MSISPFAPGQSQPGRGELHLKLLPPNTPSFHALNFTYPLKLVCSTPHKLISETRPTTNGSSSDVPAAQNIRPSNVPLVFMLSYGGGLLPPDSIDLSIVLEKGARLTLTTQGSTKIFPSSSATFGCVSINSESKPAIARQSLTATIKENAALLLAPDPVQPFARSHYEQTQIFTLAPTASLCLLDWVIEGRRARGESWQAGSWHGRNEIWQEFTCEAESNPKLEKVLMLRDAIVLDGGSGGPGQSSLKREGMGVFGTIIMAGPSFENLGKFFMNEFAAQPRIGGRKWGDEDDELMDSDETTRQLHSWRAKRIDQEVKDRLLWTAAHVRTSVIVKFTATELEGAKRWIDSMWRYEGTVGEDFGDGGFMCLR